MKKPNQFKVFDTADSMQAAASRLGVALEVVKRLKVAGCPAFRGSRVNLRTLAEAIAADAEPDTILFPIPTGPKCKPKAVEDFRELLRVAIQSRWLSASEILEILLQQIIEVLGHEKLPRDVAEKLADPIHIGFGTAVMVLEPAVVDQFLGQSATRLEALAKSLNKPRNRKLSSPRAAASGSRSTKPKQAAKELKL